jgi:hypothetical protein
MQSNSITKTWSLSEFKRNKPKIPLLYYKGRYLATISDNGIYYRFMDENYVYTMLGSECEAVSTHPNIHHLIGPYIYKIVNPNVIMNTIDTITGLRDLFVRDHLVPLIPIIK